MVTWHKTSVEATVYAEEAVEVYESDSCKDLFQAKNLYKTITRHAYGGQIVGQALRAAAKTLKDQSFVVRSFHCYFLKFVDPSVSTYYKVENTRDGRTFCARTITCLQNEQATFQCLALFYKKEDISAELIHEGCVMPDVPSPGGRPCNQPNYVLLADSCDFLGRTIDVQFCVPNNWSELLEQKKPVAPRGLVWIKAKGSNLHAADQNLQRAILAYMSDYSMARIVLLKYPEFKPGLLTSLDHTVWFHVPVYSNKWYLLDTECEHAIGGSALNIVRIFSEDGTLVATARQESLIRPRL